MNSSFALNQYGLRSWLSVNAVSPNPWWTQQTVGISKAHLQFRTIFIPRLSDSPNIYELKKEVCKKTQVYIYIQQVFITRDFFIRNNSFKFQVVWHSGILSMSRSNAHDSRRQGIIRSSIHPNMQCIIRLSSFRTIISIY